MTTFDPLLYQELADGMRAWKPDERIECAKQRTNISRYYFAALLTARNYLSAQNLYSRHREETTQEAVLKALRQVGDRESQIAAHLLATLRDARNHADYGDCIGDMEKQVESAKQLFYKVQKQIGTLSRRYL